MQSLSSFRIRPRCCSGCRPRSKLLQSVRQAAPYLCGHVGACVLPWLLHAVAAVIGAPSAMAADIAGVSGANPTERARSAPRPMVPDVEMSLRQWTPNDGQGYERPGWLDARARVVHSRAPHWVESNPMRSFLFRNGSGEHSDSVDVCPLARSSGIRITLFCIV